MRNRTVAMSAALALDNVGSGLYVPVAALFLINVRDLSVASTGIALGAGTAVGLAAPLLAGILVDRVGPRSVLATGQLLQALAMAGYLFLPGVGGAFVSSAVFSAGMQLFYGSLFALLSALQEEGKSHDRFFALIDMVRSGAYGAGALVGAGLLAWNATALPWLLGGNLALSLVGAIVVLTVPVPRAMTGLGHGAAERGPGILTDRPFLGMILLCFLISIGLDFFLVAFPVVAVEQLSTPAWLPSLCVALLTLATSTLAVATVRLTRTRSRAFALTAGVVVLLGWVAMMGAAYVVPSGLVPALLVLATVVLAAATLLIGTRANAAAHDMAPRRQLGLYLATFQYAFSVASLVAPLLLAAFAVALWLPWLLVALAFVAALVLIPFLRRSVPHRALDRTVAEGDQGDERDLTT